MSDTSKHVKGFWQGHVIGTNRGSVITRIKHSGESIQANAILEDQTYGSSMLSLIGKLSGNQATLRLFNFRGLAPATPLDGQLTLKFDEAFQNAKGDWQSDIGTQGTCDLYSITMSRLRWWTKLFGVRLRIFFLKHIVAIYMVLLFVITLLDIVRIFQISYPALILLVIPAPYIFRRQLAELILSFRVRKIGPVELEQNPPPAEISQVITQKLLQDALIFLVFDNLMVPTTKVMLALLAANKSVNREQFNAYATAIRIPTNNLDTIWKTLVVAGCASEQADRLTITDLGNRYISYFLDQAVKRTGKGTS